VKDKKTHEKTMRQDGLESHYHYFQTKIVRIESIDDRAVQ